MGAIDYLCKPVTKIPLDQVLGHFEDDISLEIKKLLVAEDDSEVRKPFVQLTENDNVDIIIVGSGQEAYDLLKTENFDCMVLDVALPDILGIRIASTD